MCDHKKAVMIPPVLALWAVFVAVMGGSRNADQATIAHPTDSVEVAPRYPASASTLFPKGNKRTLEFLDWARSKYAHYGSVKLDDNGDIIRLQVDICYNVTDEELKVIAKLPRLERLVFNTSDMTDEGLKHLQAIKSLRELSIIGYSKSGISASAVQQLKRRNPALKVNLSH